MDKKLPHGAYGGVSGKDYVPYVTDKENKGGNLAVFIIGLFLAALFAASTTYSGLKAGLTVAAGIPSAIIGGALVTAFAKKKGILGSNIVQGMGSAGESVASGVIFVMPAIFIIGGTVGYVEAVVAGIAGVLIGIGVASLVHNYLLIEEHGKLMYPESMAISETLVASEAGGESLKFMGIGFVVGGIITTLTSSVLGLWKETMTFVGDAAYKWRFELEVNPLLLGIGFIVGLEVAMLMFAGSILANFAVTPLIGYFAEMAPSTVTIWNDPATAINVADAATLSGSYTKYIGAGMMLAGGLLGAIKLIPVIVNSIKQTMGAKGSAGGEKSLQGIILLGGLIIAAVASVLVSGGNVTMMIVGFLITLVLMFLFIIVAGRLTGTIGTSNLPVSGMVIASLVVMTLIFLVFGWKNPEANKSLLMFATLLVTSIAIAGGYMQSQKVTYIVGGNKNEMQKFYAIAGILGVLVVMGVMMVLAPQLADPKGGFAMPQANLMATLTSGIMSGELPWAMIISGVLMAIAFELLGLPIMTVAIGFYLPISTSSIILVGALIRVLIEKTTKDETVKESRLTHGVSLSSGLVAGGSIIGLIGIVLKISGVIADGTPAGFLASNPGSILLLVILLLCVVVPLYTSKTHKEHPQDK